MEVVDSPYRAGDLLHGYQAVADNLPNDPRVHVEKGSKKIFWKNFMDARVNFIILPLAQRMMRPDQSAMATGDGYLADTILHEISHGLGPSYSRTAQGKIDINEAIGASYSSLEESKADVVGEFCLHWLVDHGVVPNHRIPVRASDVGVSLGLRPGEPVGRLSCGSLQPELGARSEHVHLVDGHMALFLRPEL